jgi:hypothetical protein
VRLFALTAALLCHGCGDDHGSSAGASPARSASGSPAASQAPSRAQPSSRQAPSAAPADGVELLAFQLTSGVKNKEAVDKLASAPPGERVYAHLTVRNRTSGPQRVSVSFRVNDDERTMVDLTVEKSWSWRTWAYVTLRKEDKGTLMVHAFDDHGAELGTESIPIR